MCSQKYSVCFDKGQSDKLCIACDFIACCNSVPLKLRVEIQNLTQSNNHRFLLLVQIGEDSQPIFS